MKRVYEGVQKDKRKEFKHFMDWVGAKYSFRGDTATVSYEEPYFIPAEKFEEEMQKKCDFKRAMQQGIIEFRNYCFNEAV